MFYDLLSGVRHPLKETQCLPWKHFLRTNHSAIKHRSNPFRVQNIWQHTTSILGLHAFRKFLFSVSCSAPKHQLSPRFHRSSLAREEAQVAAHYQGLQKREKIFECLQTFEMDCTMCFYLWIYICVQSGVDCLWASWKYKVKNYEVSIIYQCP